MTDKDPGHAGYGGQAHGRHPSSPVMTLQARYKDWYATVEIYSDRNLTFPRDKLPALSGYAHKMHETIGGAYYAGLWRNDLRNGLLWHSQWSARKAPVSRPSSWSWASIDGGIGHLGTWEDRYRCKIISCSVTLSTDDPMGEVTSGTLVIAGILTAAECKKDKTPFSPPSLYVTSDQPHDPGTSGPQNTRSTDSENEIGTIVKRECKLGDCQFDIEDQYIIQRRVWCLSIAGDCDIVLEPVARKEGVYRRIGSFQWVKDTKGYLGPITTVTII